MKRVKLYCTYTTPNVSGTTTMWLFFRRWGEDCIPQAKVECAKWLDEDYPHNAPHKIQTISVQAVQDTGCSVDIRGGSLN